MTQIMTKNAYRKRLVSCAQAIEAHAFGERVEIFLSDGWASVPNDWNEFNLSEKYRILRAKKNVKN